eukprot:maker-scaffold159_size295958-snap-gene-1.33 protein:Tk05088 transcript:maker-scaffold159_size295958-snap-gene-1.33-mRNA-1 annotation:"hypothetical protein KGM_18218"
MEAWTAYRSTDGANNSRNPVGNLLFADKRSRSTRAETEGTIGLPPTTNLCVACSRHLEGLQSFKSGSHQERGTHSRQKPVKEGAHLVSRKVKLVTLSGRGISTKALFAPNSISDEPITMSSSAFTGCQLAQSGPDLLGPKLVTSQRSLALVLLILLLPSLISSHNEGNSKRDSSEYEPPFLFGDGPGNTTVQVGGTAYLHCPVINLGERQLTWIRRRDWHILTHESVTFTTDDRFQLVKEENSDDWVLQIKHVVARDTGAYECQATTDSGIKSRRVDLQVVTPEAFILADEEYHIDRGSSLSLVCIIEKATTPPQYVFWYHNERMINYDSERGISVTTTPGRKTHSQLFIQRADVSDSGNYTCEPSSSIPASIQVFVS